MLIRIGSRKSDLARIQAYAVGEALEELDSSIKIEYKFSASIGDKNLTDPLWKAPEQGIFTMDLYKDLIADKTDINVHSWKDLPTETNDITAIFATLKRENPHDLLLVKNSAMKSIRKNRKMTIASSSPRRIYNINAFLPSLLPFEVNQIEWKDVRGNIQTRLRKVFEQEYDGIIVAKAAIDRLIDAKREEFQETKELVTGYVKDCRWMILPLTLNPSAAAQGGLAIEAKRDNKKIIALLEQINHKEVFNQINKERELHKSYGGGCHQKLGINYINMSYGEILSKKGLLDSHGEIDSFDFTSQVVTTPISENEFYPNHTDPHIFERTASKLESNKIANKNLLISRANALPLETAIDKSTLLWSAGLSTWRKLAKAGYWVHGSNESLGEELFNSIEFSALQANSREWVKLTHKDSPEELSSLNAVHTYELKPSRKSIDWSTKKVCYWMSSSAFLQAYSQYPNIIEAKHICGPGITYQVLKKYIKPELIQLDLNFSKFYQANIKG